MCSIYYIECDYTKQRAGDQTIVRSSPTNLLLLFLFYYIEIIINHYYNRDIFEKMKAFIDEY